ncbi:2'-5' RNA ligase [Frankia sp. CcI156]|uniref:RNA 2',3'-cyclic phosphodiesterase n=1 Tax=Frankia casuarinae (strain DSM 45818 / CECT 9043 / HFP020203 / CcI3) TaxID=106370 RepID=Q2JGW0_FRACC|nr:2',5' RNA ligase [Frankia casuarinae]OFB42368.1 2'-5' RNA ligase [Frankia sp. CgIM4]OHV52332.1 2'-5' RNA ligase [Frankia sp. CgIS1]ONH25947.1 2'-5' RNA ligase [Frankia sp. CcI156]ORT95247.1 2'-5' RNA ligase [Frankia casuarinae]
MATRLFVAAVPPPEVAEALLAAVRRTRAAAADLRWTTPDQWHVTFAFLGPVPDDRRAELGVRLARVARRHGPFAVETVGGGRFGDRVLWTAVRQPPPVTADASVDGIAAAAAAAAGDVAGSRASPRLTALAVGVRRAAERAGAARRNTRPLRAHLTLARVPNGRGRALEPLVELLRADVPPLPWSVERLILMSSSGGGESGSSPTYRAETVWDLVGGQPSVEGSAGR